MSIETIKERVVDFIKTSRISLCCLVGTIIGCLIANNIYITATAIAYNILMVVLEYKVRIEEQWDKTVKPLIDVFKENNISTVCYKGDEKGDAYIIEVELTDGNIVNITGPDYYCLVEGKFTLEEIIDEHKKYKLFSEKS